MVAGRDSNLGLASLRGRNWVEGLSRIPKARDWQDSAVAKHVDQLTMPPGALASLLIPYCRLMASDDGWQRKTPLRFASLIFAADHEIVTSTPVSAYPQVVTRQMLRNFLSGGACHSVLAGKRCVSQTVVDVGTSLQTSLNGDVLKPAVGSERVYFIEAHIPLMLGLGEAFRSGCRDPRFDDSLGSDVARETFRKGAQIAQAIIDRDKPNAIILGEMGIGNTTASTAIAEIILEAQSALAGRGSGITEGSMLLKKQAIAQIRERFEQMQNATPSERASAVYGSVAGFEHLALAGAAYAAALKGVYVILDGLIVTSALAPLLEVQSDFGSWLIAGHVGSEPAHRALVSRYQLEALLHLGLRLGEGSGALLAAGLLEDAHELVCKMATFHQAGVSSSSGGL